MNKAGIKLSKLSAFEELDLSKQIGNVFSYVYSRLGSPEGAYAVSHNAALLCASLRGAFDIGTPMDVLKEFNLEEISCLAKTYHEIYHEHMECGFNENFEEADALE